MRVGAGDGHVPSLHRALFCAFCFCVCTSQVLDAMMCRAACGVRIVTSPSQHHRCQPLDTLAGLLVSLQQGSAEPFQLSTSSYPSRLIRNEGLPENMTPYEGRAAFRADEFIAGPLLHLVFRNWLLHCAIASIARISDRQCQPLSSVRRLASSQRGAVSFVSINASRALRLSILTKHHVPTAPISNRAPRTAISTPPNRP